jgi:N-methylhydantoinase A
MSRVVGCDVGGTFTDLILLDESAGTVRIAKVPTTMENQAFGFMAALRGADADLAKVDLIVHGTTTTTNALLERKVARCGLITTQGFRDVLELGRRTRPNPYGMTGTFTPLIARQDRLEVPERVDAQGNVLTPLDEAAVRTAARQLADAGCESLVIHFLHSYVNPAHELRAAEIAAEVWPNAYITTGHTILPEFREYERGVAGAVNGAIRPVLDRYVRRLRNELAENGYRHDLLVMQGNGGSVSSAIVAEAAINTVMSGPASGVIAAAYTASGSGYPDVVTYDMGGTSTDVGLIRAGIPSTSAELQLEYGMPVHVPMVDVHSIGAGGGSIAFINDAGLLQVGPRSAGATPGPICYGRGGAEPTITDANLVLGRLNPGRLLAVDSPVSLDDVRAALVEHVGRHLGLDAEESAAAIVRVANNRMAGAVRMVSLARGHDPRDFALFAFGGAGPLHAVALARELAIPRVLVPARPGITNAIGCVVADLRHDYVRTLNKPLAEVDMAEVAAILRQQIAEGRATLEREGADVEAVQVIHDASMQFQGQSHMLTVAIPDPDITAQALHEAFAEVYFDRFALRLPEIRPVLVGLHTAVIGKRPPVSLASLMDADRRVATLTEAQVDERKVRFDEAEMTTPIYARERLPLGAAFDGPAIVEQLDSTTVIDPDCHVTVDPVGNLIVAVPQRRTP